MLDLRLRYVGDGHFVTATKADFDAAGREYKHGQEIVARTSHKSSMKQGARLHCIIQDAHASQSSGAIHPTWEHLKAHILNAIGHCDIKRFAPEAMTREASQAIRGAFHVEFFVDARTKEIIMKTPRRTRDMSAEQMAFLIDRVTDYIALEVLPGVNVDDIKGAAKAKR